METSTEPLLKGAGRSSLSKSSVRWWICGGLFLATTICYIDRQTTSVLKSTLLEEFKLNEAHFGLINFCFTLAYALTFPFAGKALDRFGVRKVLTISVIFWSVAAMGHALVGNYFLGGAAGGFIGLCVARFLLGVGEAATFPACVKVAGEWLPKQERALGAGIFNAGANSGMALSFLTVWIAAAAGHWQWAFLATGATGLIWVFYWLRVYHPLDKHPRVSDKERDYIHAGQPKVTHSQPLSWTTILRQREAWPFLIGKMITDPVWWFYMFWLAGYIKEKFYAHLSRSEAEAAAVMWLVFIYIIADIGSIFGGWFSGFLIKRGWDVAPARYTAMGVSAAMMPLAIGAIYTDNIYLFVSFIALATAGHQGFSSNLFTTTTDLFPSRVVGAVNGMGGLFSGVGSMIMTLAIGIMLSYLGHITYGSGKYFPAFIWAGFMHPLAVVIYFLVLGRKFKVVDIDPAAPQPRSMRLTASGIVLALAGAISLTFCILKYDKLVELSNLEQMKNPAAIKAPVTPAPAAPSSAAAPKPVNWSVPISATVGSGLFILIGGALVYAGMPRGPKKLQGGFPVVT
jgi:ACS family hexuronate transporter-like MFS transporter